MVYKLNQIIRDKHKIWSTITGDFFICTIIGALVEAEREKLAYIIFNLMSFHPFHSQWVSLIFFLFQLSK